MQQHPIPQNVTAFEFKLVGFLTLRQFIYLAIAGVLDFIIFVSFESTIRYFVIGILALVAAALAFFPVNGMSFDKWIVIFIRAITTPSRRIWLKEEKIFSFLQPEFDYYLRRPAVKTTGPDTGKVKLKEYLNQIRSESKSNDEASFDFSKYYPQYSNSGNPAENTPGDLEVNAERKF